jgi:hypothetical protein
MEYLDKLSCVILFCVKNWMCEIMAWCEVCCAGGEQTAVLAWTNVRGGLLVVLKVHTRVSSQAIKS